MFINVFISASYIYFKRFFGRQNGRFYGRFDSGFSAEAPRLVQPGPVHTSVWGQVSHSNILNRLVIALMLLKPFHRTTHGHVMDAKMRANFRHGVSAREVRPRHRFGAFGVAKVRGQVLTYYANE
jgi:hypothetical protein